MTAEDIDKHNVFQETHKSMNKAFDKLLVRPEQILVDEDKFYVSFLEIDGPIGSFENILNKNTNK